MVAVQLDDAADRRARLLGGGHRLDTSRVPAARFRRDGLGDVRDTAFARATGPSPAAAAAPAAPPPAERIERAPLGRIALAGRLPFGRAALQGLALVAFTTVSTWGIGFEFALSVDRLRVVVGRRQDSVLRVHLTQSVLRGWLLVPSQRTSLVASGRRRRSMVNARVFRTSGP